MSQTIEAIFDGQVFHPVEPLDIEPNTRVTVHIETPERDEREPYAFLSVLREAKLEGPPD
jgi:predicted DNA-binding antitoxin AbrB/MazE fold protein